MKALKKLSMAGLAVVLLFSTLCPREAGAVSASSAILMEQHSGRVLYEKNAHEPRRIASITKVMTAILAIESGKLDEEVKVSRRAVFSEGSSIYLQQGEKIKLRDLVYGLMLRSGNDAAAAIAEHVGGSLEGFVFLMNRKAEEIGMKDTSFSNPSGLDTDDEHYSTPYDMALLTRYAMENGEYAKIAGAKVHQFNRGAAVQRWTNKHRLLTEKYKHTTGGKTGFTKKAGRTLISTASQNGLDLIVVTLNGPDDWRDHMNLFEEGFRKYEMTSIVESGPVEGLKTGGKVELRRPFSYPLAEDEREKIKLSYEMTDPENRRQGEIAGKVTVLFDGEAVKKLPVYASEEEEAKEKSGFRRFFERLFFRNGSDGS